MSNPGYLGFVQACARDQASRNFVGEEQLYSLYGRSLRKQMVGTVVYREGIVLGKANQVRLEIRSHRLLWFDTLPYVAIIFDRDKSK